MRILIAMLLISIAGCTIVKINNDDTTTIDHNAGVGVAEDLANRACRRAGKQAAKIISTVNQNASLPPGTGKQTTTFRCI